MFAKFCSMLAVFALLSVCQAHADASFDDASQALENLDELVESVDRTGRALERLVQPRQDPLRWPGGDRLRTPGWSQWRAPSSSPDMEIQDDVRQQ